jgi:uncharacterized protein (TIGR03083 family)
MRLPLLGDAIDELRAERHRLIETLEGLTDAEFDSGRTLCTEWSPRDVLGHVIGIDYFVSSYLPYGPRIGDANAAQVHRARQLSRTRLMKWAGHWADNPSPTTRLSAPIMLGDLAVHHQDVLRGLGLSREIPDRIASAVLLEGSQLSIWINRRVLTHRIVPTDGGRPYGRGPEVLGSREALGMWLAGRDSVASELFFSG